MVRGLLIAVASLVAEHGLQAHGLSSCSLQALGRRLSSCGARAQLLRGMWDLPGSGLKPVSPALAGGFLTTAPPGKFKTHILYKKKNFSVYNGVTLLYSRGCHNIVNQLHFSKKQNKIETPILSKLILLLYNNSICIQVAFLFAFNNY